MRGQQAAGVLEARAEEAPGSRRARRRRRAPRARGRGSAGRRSPAARRRRLPTPTACAARALSGVERRVDVDQVEVPVGQQREHGGVVALDQQVVVEGDVCRGADHPHGATVTLASFDADGSASGRSAAPPAPRRGARAHRRGGRGGVDSDRRRARDQRRGWLQRLRAAAHPPLARRRRELRPAALRPRPQRHLRARAAAGFSHPLYAKSPGGVAATAKRVERWRPQIEKAAAAAGIDADTLEAVVFLESAGDPEAMAGPDPRAAAGLTQILPGTATQLLGMHVDLPREHPHHPRHRQGRSARRRRRASRRCCSGASASTTASTRSRRWPAPPATCATRAATSRARTSPSRPTTWASATCSRSSPPSAPVTTRPTPSSTSTARRPPRRPRTRSSSRSATTPPRTGSGCWRPRTSCAWPATDPAELQRRAELQTQKNSAENLLHPPEQTTVFAAPADLGRAETGHVLLPLDARGLLRAGVRVDPHMGELAPKLGQKPALYRALRPEALARWRYIGAGVHAFRRPRGAHGHQHGARQPLPAAAASGRTSRPRRTTRSTPPATPSTSSATTRRRARPTRSSSSSTACRRST